MKKTNPKLFVVIPNLNGRKNLGEKDFSNTIKSILNQSQKCKLIIVDNGSTDKSEEFIKKHFPEVIIIRNEKNRGFAGGVNDGIRYAIEKNADAVALFNSDAIADKDWLKYLWSELLNNKKAGISTGKFLKQIPKNEIDSTGDLYSIWGAAYPRGRGEQDSKQFDDDKHKFVLGGTGGASLYRVAMLKDIGLFDERFFAYYEDVDISLRAQLQGWKCIYAPKSIAYHGLSKTSSTMPGFINYHILKNSVYLYTKNMPASLYWKNLWRFMIVLSITYYKTLKSRMFVVAIKAFVATTVELPLILIDRYRLQKRKKVSAKYISSILLHSLPPGNSIIIERLVKRSNFGKAYDEIDI